jgi:hypothetical protein
MDAVFLGVLAVLYAVTHGLIVAMARLGEVE